MYNMYVCVCYFSRLLFYLVSFFGFGTVWCALFSSYLPIFFVCRSFSGCSAKLSPVRFFRLAKFIYSFLLPLFFVFHLILHLHPVDLPLFFCVFLLFLVVSNCPSVAPLHRTIFTVRYPKKSLGSYFFSIFRHYTVLFFASRVYIFVFFRRERGAVEIYYLCGSEQKKIFESNTSRSEREKKKH